MSKFLDDHKRRMAAKGRDVSPTLASLFPELAPPAPVAPARPAPAAPAYVPVLARRPRIEAPVAPARVLVSEFEAVRSLTACLDDAPCRESARRIFRTLYGLALHVARAQGMSAAVSRVVFHLPAELVYSHVDLGKSAFYDNLQYLTRAGLVACEAHMGALKGHARNVATGTLWAVSLAPERVLSGQRAPVRLVHDDWCRPWRDLNADVAAGRTVAALLGITTAPRKDADQDDQKQVSKSSAGQSSKRKRLLTKFQTLKAWAIHPFLSHKPDTETVREAQISVVDVVWDLGAGSTPRPERGAHVERQARRLCAAFGDSEDSLRFWLRLVWNITRGQDAGTDLAEDVGAVLARVLRDIEHDFSAAGRTNVRSAGRVVNRALSEAGLLDNLADFAMSVPRVGNRPAGRAA